VAQQWAGNALNAATATIAFVNVLSPCLRQIINETKHVKSATG
jgi:hypothetical protein